MAQKKRYGKIGWDYHNPRKFKALKKRRNIAAIKITGCVVLIFWLIIIPAIFIVKLIEQALNVQILPR